MAAAAARQKGCGGQIGGRPMNVSDLRGRLNLFLHRQTVRRLTEAEIALARDWCMDLIHREHPELTAEQAERFYENLIHVRVIAVDEWTQRMS